MGSNKQYGKDVKKEKEQQEKKGSWENEQHRKNGKTKKNIFLKTHSNQEREK